MFTIFYVSKNQTLRVIYPLVALVFIYAGHAIGGLLGLEEYQRLVAVLGFSPEVTKLLVFSIFPLDAIVTLLLIFGDKISANFPWKMLFLWVAFWPWIPRALEFMGGFEVEFGDGIVVVVLACLAYRFHQRHNISLCKRS